jgi:hypothetical protein
MKLRGIIRKGIRLRTVQKSYKTKDFYVRKYLKLLYERFKHNKKASWEMKPFCFSYENVLIVE